MSLPMITGTGRLVDDPSLWFTSTGKAVASMRIAFSDRKRDEQGNWSDGDRVFLDATVWGQEAENLCESLARGHEVLVSGKFKQREYDAKDGTKKTVYEVAFATVAPTLRTATAKVQKMSRGSGGNAPTGGVEADPWSTAAPATGGSRAGSGFDDSEVPF